MMVEYIITPDKLPAVTREILEKWVKENDEKIVKVTTQTTRQGAKMMNASASSVIHGRRGKYEKSWKARIEGKRLSVEGIIYSSQPGLPHLLEHGHSITYLGGNKAKGPGKARAIPHIAKTEEEINKLYEENVIKEVQKG